MTDHPACPKPLHHLVHLLWKSSAMNVVFVIRRLRPYESGGGISNQFCGCLGTWFCYIASVVYPLGGAGYYFLSDRDQIS